MKNDKDFAGRARARIKSEILRTVDLSSGSKTIWQHFDVWLKAEDEAERVKKKQAAVEVEQEDREIP